MSAVIPAGVFSAFFLSGASRFFGDVLPVLPVIAGDSMLVEILTAVCLVLVLEGLLPFLNPAAYKKAVRAMLEMPDAQLRIVGLSSMIGGVILLAIVR